MNNKWLSKFTLWAFVTIIIIVSIYLFIRVSDIWSSNILEGMSQNHMILQDVDGQPITRYKLDTDTLPTKMVPTDENFRTSKSNYFLFKSILPGEKPQLQFNPSNTINLISDYFDKIWDQDTDSFKVGFIEGLFTNGCYVEPNTDSPMYFIRYKYIIDFLESRGVSPPDKFEAAKQVCGEICKQIPGNYSTVLIPVFDGDTWIDDYGDWIFFVIIKRPPIIQSIPTHIVSNTSHPIGNHTYSQTRGYSTLNNSSQAQTNMSSDRPDPMSNLNTLTSGIIFYLGNCKNFTSGWTSINAVTINSNGLQLLMCDENDISESSGNLITDTTYIDNLSSFDKYLAKYTQKLEVDYTLDYNRVDTLKSINPDVISDQNSGSLTLKWNYGWWPDIEYQYNSIPITSGNQGTQRSFDNIRFNTLNSGQKRVKSDVGMGFGENGTWEFSSTNPISRKYFPKTTNDANDNCYSMPVTFTPKLNSDNNTNNTIPYHNIEYNLDQTSNYIGDNVRIEIDSDEGKVIYTDGNNRQYVLFSIYHYGGLTPNDLVSNTSWTTVTGNLGNGIFKKGDILGVNGGNKEYLMDSSKKMRLWFDIHGTMHVEISLKRDVPSKKNVLTACSKKMNELFSEYNTHRRNAGNYFNLFNYSGTPLHSALASMLLLMFEETQVVKVDPKKQDIIGRMGISQNDNEDGDLQLFYNQIQDSPANWTRAHVDIDTTGCNSWFKHSNIYENNIDIAGLECLDNVTTNQPNPLLINTIRGNRGISDNNNNNSNLVVAQDECAANPDCYGVTHNANDNVSKLWRKNGIRQNYHGGEASVFKSDVYDGYLKICPTRDGNVEAAGFHGDSSSMDYSVTPLTAVQTIDADLLISHGNLIDKSELIPKHVDITPEIISKFLADDNRVEKLIRQVGNGGSSNTWYQIDPDKLAGIDIPSGQSYLLDRIGQNINISKLQNKILTSKQTNREDFYKKLDEIIYSEITQPLLNAKLDSTSKTAARQRASNDNSSLTQGGDGTALLNSTTNELSGFTNIDSNTQTAIKETSDAIIKKMVFNIDNENNSSRDTMPNLDVINITILVIFVTILIIGLINFKKQR